MKKPETPDFNRYKDSYQDEIQHAISFSGQNLDFFTEAKARCLLEAAERHIGPAGELRLLDIGCGVGLTDAYIVSSVKELHGVDVAADLVAKAAVHNPAVSYQSYDGKQLPFQDCSFDLVFAICVMHHVPLDERRNFIREAKRVVKQGGMVVIFEHNPFNPLTRFVVSRSPMYNGAVLVSGKKMLGLMRECGLDVIDERYIIFFPFRAKLVALLEKFLSRVPLGAQYYVAGKLE